MNNKHSNNTVSTMLSKLKQCLLVICVSTSFGANAKYYAAPEHKVFGSPAVASDALAIDDLMAELWRSWASHEASTFANLHANDAEWTNAFGRTFRGSKALAAFLEKRLFVRFDIEIAKHEAETYREVSRRYIGAESAVITGRIESNRGSSVGSSNRKIGFTFVLGKIDGQWKLTNQVITDLRERRG